MIWQIRFTNKARKELRNLDQKIQNRILQYLKDNIAAAQTPRIYGKPLVGTLKGLWRFRVGDYRVVCRIEDEAILILVLRVAHRKDVYEFE